MAELPATKPHQCPTCSPVSLCLEPGLSTALEGIALGCAWRCQGRGEHQCHQLCHLHRLPGALIKQHPHGSRSYLHYCKFLDHSLVFHCKLIISIIKRNIRGLSWVTTAPALPALWLQFIINQVMMTRLAPTSKVIFVKSKIRKQT